MSFLAMRAHYDTMAHATVRTTEIGRLPDHAEHGLIPKGRTISAAAAWLWVATHNHARTKLLLKNVTSCCITGNLRYKGRHSDRSPDVSRGEAEESIS
jgi:hypothetical protein